MNVLERIDDMKNTCALPDNVTKRVRVKPVPIPISREQLLLLGEELEYNEEAFALWNILYPLGARICEVVGDRGKGTPGLTWNDISKDESTKTFTFRLFTEKNRIAPYRIIPVSYSEENPVERTMLGHFLRYAKTCSRNHPIFEIDRHCAKYYFSKIKTDMTVLFNPFDPKNKRPAIIHDWEFHPHYLRHCRATDMATIYNYSLLQLMTFFGWTTPAPAMIYVKLNWKNLAEPFNQSQILNIPATQPSNTGGASV